MGGRIQDVAIRREFMTINTVLIDIRKGNEMGEAKRRGTFDDRKKLAISKANERKRMIQEKQKEERLEVGVAPLKNTLGLAALAMAMVGAGTMMGQP